MDAGTHLYYASNGLNKPEKVMEGCSAVYLTHPNFENDFCAISWIDEDEYKRIIDYLR